MQYKYIILIFISIVTVFGGSKFAKNRVTHNFRDRISLESINWFDTKILKLEYGLKFYYFV